MTSNPPPRLVVFDCDGTLVDSQASIVVAMQSAFAEHGLPAPTPGDVRRRVGLSLLDFVVDLVPGIDPERAQRVTDSYRRAFAAGRHRNGSDTLFPGIEDLLVDLDEAGVLLGVATGKSRRGLVALLEELQLRDRFATLQTADDAPSKPHPGMLMRAMEETGAEAAETVFVGDTVFDVEAALNADVRPIGVAWGYHAAEELLAHGAALVVDSAQQLRRELGLDGPRGSQL